MTGIYYHTPTKEENAKLYHSHVPVICEQVQAGTSPMEGPQAEGK